MSRRQTLESTLVRALGTFPGGEGLVRENGPHIKVVVFHCVAHLQDLLRLLGEDRGVTTQFEGRATARLSAEGRVLGHAEHNRELGELLVARRGALEKQIGGRAPRQAKLARR